MARNLSQLLMTYNPEVLLDFAESVGPTLNDASGNGRHFTVSGTPAFQQASFNPAKQSAIRLPKSPATSAVNADASYIPTVGLEFTAFAVVKPNAAGGTANPAIMQQWDWTISRRSWMVYLTTAGVRCAVSFDGSYENRAETSAAPIAIGAWHTIAMTYQHGVVTLYIDKTPVVIAGSFIKDKTIQTFPASQSPIRLARGDGSPVTSSEHADITLDAFAIIPRRLDMEDIAALHDNAMADIEVAIITSTVSGLVSVNGQPAARTVRAYSYDAIEQAVDGATITASKSLGHAVSNAETGAYSIDIQGGFSGPVIVAAFDDYGAEFSGGAAVGLGQRIHPATPNGYVYEVTSAGTLPASEPSWSTDTGQTFLVGTATVRPAIFYRPDIHGPVYPVVS